VRLGTPTLCLRVLPGMEAIGLGLKIIMGTKREGGLL
jgi:hypothetical protein